MQKKETAFEICLFFKKQMYHMQNLILVCNFTHTDIDVDILECLSEFIQKSDLQVLEVKILVRETKNLYQLIQALKELLAKKHKPQLYECRKIETDAHSGLHIQRIIRNGRKHLRNPHARQNYHL